MEIAQLVLAAVLATTGTHAAGSNPQTRVDIVMGADGSVTVNGEEMSPPVASRTSTKGASSTRREMRATADGRRTIGSPVLEYTTGTDGTITLRRRPDGHFIVPMKVNGVTIRAAIDTGATDTFMTKEDAASTGADRSAVGLVPTKGIAGSTVATRSRLRAAKVGMIDLGTPTVLVGGGMGMTLLGLPEIARLGRIVIEGDTMTITPRRKNAMSASKTPIAPTPSDEGKREVGISG